MPLNAKNYMVQYSPIELGANNPFQQMAQVGYGDLANQLLQGRLGGIQGQYLSNLQGMTGSFGRRGLYNSSIYGQGLASLLGQRETQVAGATADINKMNQDAMLKAQQYLEQLRQFNASNQLQADMYNRGVQSKIDQFNQQQALQQQMYDLQRKNSRRGFFSSLTNLAVPLLGSGNPFGIAAGGLLGLTGLAGSNWG